MTSWEERMADAAYVRRMQRDAERQAEEELADAEFRARLEEENKAAKDAGPDNGCFDCHFWSELLPFPPGSGWFHGESLKPGPMPVDLRGFADETESNWCYHQCHTDGPVYCGPIVFG